MTTRLAAAILSAAALTAVVAVPAIVPPPAHAAGTSRRALDRPMPEVRFENTPLVDAIGYLSDTSGANFSVDWRVLEAAHVAKDAPITLKVSAGVPLRKVLGLVLRQAGSDGPLTFHVADGVIEITTQEADDKVLISRTYGIQDLLFVAPDYNNAPQLNLQTAGQGQQAGGGGGGGGGQSQSLFQNAQGNQNQNNSSQADRAAEIIKLITDTVKPELWQINGGTATISFFRGMLIVNAPRSIHEMLESH